MEACQVYFGANWVVLDGFGAHNFTFEVLGLSINILPELDLRDRKSTV